MPPIVVGVILWAAGKLALLGLLVLLHWARRRLHSVPPPLFQRRAPVAGSARLFEGMAGVGAGYALCAATFFAGMVSTPAGATLSLIPAQGGPAEQAGVLRGDVAHSVEGTAVKSFDEFRQAVQRAPESVSIEVERNGRVVPLSVRKNEHNLIGVAPMPGPSMAAATALPRAIAAPAQVLAAWVSSAVRSLAGEATETAGIVGFGSVVSGGNVPWTPVLALLMAKNLGPVALVYVVILAADARSRARYQASNAGAARLEGAPNGTSTRIGLRLPRD